MASFWASFEEARKEAEGNFGWRVYIFLTTAGEQYAVAEPQDRTSFESTPKEECGYRLVWECRGNPTPAGIAWELKLPRGLCCALEGKSLEDLLIEARILEERPTGLRSFFLGTAEEEKERDRRYARVLRKIARAYVEERFRERMHRL